MPTRLAIVFAVCFVPVLLSACGGPPETRPDHPAALGRGVEVLIGPPADGTDAEDGPEALGARYVLEPDGTLRAQLGTTMLERRFPPFIRLLEPAERARVLELAEAAVAAGTPARLGPVTDAQGHVPPGVRVVVHRGATAEAAASTSEQPEARALVDHLESLAWVGG